MKKHLLSLGLALALTIGLCTPAFAAEYSADNFIRTKTYAGEFSDVTPDSTFYGNVAALFEYGLSVGKADGTFGLKDSVTVGQIVIFAGRVRSLYALGGTEAGAQQFPIQGQSAYVPYLYYLQNEGVLGGELEGQYALPATRAQVAHVLASILPEEALPLINDDLITQCYASRQFITDVTEDTPYAQDILTLYRTGLSVGGDATGSFQPGAAITRGALAAMLTRMVDPALRLTPSWVVDPTVTAPVTPVETPPPAETPGYTSAAGTTWGDLVTGNTTYVAAPTTTDQVAQSVAYMLSQGSNQLRLNYGGSITSRFVNQIMDAALSGVKQYCEQMYNSVTCSYDTRGGAVTLSFTAVAAGSDLPSYRDYTLNAAIAVHDRLWHEGKITAGMTELEKARAYYTWICDNCVYDSNAGDESISHIAYSLFRNGSAVCDGYTGAYNLLLKLEGIDCYALSNRDHIWTVATLDGAEYHIDTTWGDSTTNSINYNYFAMSQQQSWNYHPW